MSADPKAVFLSYASQDAEAAKRLADSLRAAGVEVWFDTDGGLEHGDEWDAKIRRQIKECVLFVAIVSANTQAREEGYFRIEWELAAQRAMGIASGVAFILPVVIDDTKEPAALVPDRFRSVQWTRLPDGNVPADVLQRFLKLWSHRTGAVKHEAARTTQRDEGVAPPGKSTPRWLAPVIGGVVVAVIALVIARPWQKPATAPAQPVVAPAAPPLSPARQMVERALAIFNSPTDNSSAQLEMAAELCLRAQALDPADAEAWAAGARIDTLVYKLRFDGSEERRQRAQQAVAKALALAPDSKEARWAQAGVLTHVVGTPDILPEAERIYRELLRQSPDDKGLLNDLADVLRVEGRVDEAASLYEKIGSPIGAGWAYFMSGRYAEAGKVADRMLARERTYPALYLKAHVELLGFEDPEAGERTFREFPRQELLTENGASVALLVGMHRRDPDLIIRTMSAFPSDFLTKTGFGGPKRLWTGMAHEMAGRPAAARAEWTVALQQLLDRRKDKPSDTILILSEAMLRARLGQTEEAERMLSLYANLSSGGQGGIFTVSVLIRLGKKEEALAKLAAGLQAKDNGWQVLHANARYWADIDPLRDDPRFEKLLRDNLPPDARPFDDPKPQTQKPGASDQPPVDQKSVAVLAFADLSAAHDSEYFSDGISEELLNVLAKISNLKVAARTSAFYFKGKEVPIPEIARQLGVAYVVEGSVRKQGDKVRITAQLIKADGGYHVWSDTFTRDLKDIFAVQDEIAALIAKNLELKMGIGETGARQAVSPEAYQEYLLGRAAAAKAGMADLHEAAMHFDRAAALEPKYTAAWVQLATTHTQLGRWGGAPTLQSWASARAAIDRAVALEPDSPDVLLALGWIQRTAEWDWKGAERSFRRALALQPNQPEILAGAAVLLYNIGQKEEAFRLAARAIQLDPLNAASQIDLSIMYYENDNWIEAEQAARRALQLAPGGTSYHSILSWNLIRQGRYAEAEAEIAQDTDRVEQSAAYGLLAIARGEGAKTREMLGRLQEVARTQGDIADVQQCIAWLYTGLGEKDHAFAAIEKARATRDPSMSWLRNTSELKALGSDPRWPALLHQVGLADEQLK